MSVLVVVKKGGRAAIAADSEFKQGSTIVPSEMRVSPYKIHEFDGSYIGFTGSSAHHRVFGSLAKHHKEKINFDGPENIFETFRALQTILTDDYHLITKEDSDDQPYDSNHLFGLLCNKTGIYSFQSYREITEYSQYWASGSGDEFALGAMHASYDTLSDPEDIVRIGVDAACKFNDSCGLPIQVFSVDVIG